MGKKLKRKLVRKKVLVVDDEPDIVEIIMDGLTEGGYEAFGATNGADGIIVNAKENPDLIILDLRMPEMDGIETLRHIRKKDAKVRVIFLTAFGNSDIANDKDDLDISACLTKPIDDNDQLLHVIRNVLGQ